MSFVVFDVVSGVGCVQFDSREDAQRLADECNAEYRAGPNLIGFNAAYADPFIVETVHA